MIHNVDFDDGPIQPGERRKLQAWADTRMTVEIKCFTNTPPPPGYRGCPSCGVIKLESGEETYITADQGTFERAEGQGELHVILKDRTGDTREYYLRVTLEEGEPNYLSAGA